ncbi:hypothetical protein [Nocardioides convexus]|uniref:hypothetical protein n=1 Tax=Nocardioides convexus TaxID=2712224 RepID=UPI0024187886|nr:hypothetical protein [Nocardioides convexus]
MPLIRHLPSTGGRHRGPGLIRTPPPLKDYLHLRSASGLSPKSAAQGEGALTGRLVLERGPARRTRRRDGPCDRRRRLVLPHRRHGHPPRTPRPRTRAPRARRPPGTDRRGRPSRAVRDPDG